MPRYLGDDFLLPLLDPRCEPWFTSGSIQVQFCDDCGHAQHPPEDLCSSCQGTSLSFRSLSGEGRVESCVVVHHPVHPALAERGPYVVAVVSLDGAPGCNAIGNVVDCEPEAVEIGQRLRAVYEEVPDPVSGRTLRIPQWVRAG